MVIRQGDIYWVDFCDPLGPSPAYRHPYVVVENDLFNESRQNSVIVCELTSNLSRAHVAGNVLLDPCEGNLPKQSVANVSQLYTVNKQALGERVGTLSTARLREILDGIALHLRPRRVSYLS